MFLIIALSMIIFIRYVGFSYVVEFLIKKTNYKKVFTLKRKKNQRKKEILLSFYSSIIFGIAFYFLHELWVKGYISFTDETFPFWYHPLSITIALFIHETYYYWLHRVMHHKKLYKLMHKGHHDSIEVSPWTSFAFDPLETIFQVLPFYIIVFLLPLHLYSILFLLLLMSLSATINHLNYEIFPQFFKHTFPFNQLIGATHHALHHKEFTTNYGLYFTFWDKWMGTESEKY